LDLVLLLYIFPFANKKKNKAVPGQDGHGVKAVVSFHSKYQPNQINKLVDSIGKKKERKIGFYNIYMNRK
jgi:hypothetical protein